ncbi:MAG: hypothetical protein QOD83_2164 [Solirubrobacteraceae bacterium]|jgi:hypothetical protein|nr:hypothetical protein [Solirubrobacteraceae bacterium]
MDGRGEPRHQPIGILPTIARMIDQGLTDTQEQYETLLEARPKPWVLDDALVNGQSASTAKRSSGAAATTNSSNAGSASASRSPSAAK